MSGLTREIYIDGYETGEKRGIEQGKLSVLVNLVKAKLLSETEAAKQLGMSESEFAELAKV